jgi:hypothetical protein
MPVASSTIMTMAKLRIPQNPMMSGKISGTRENVPV